MRARLRTVLATDRRLEIVRDAADAIEARDFLTANNADVLTLDIEMPGMSALEFLTRLMRARPMSVVMLSSLTAEGSNAAIQVLSRGAIDCMPKPTKGYDAHLSRDVCERVYHAACTRPSQLRGGRRDLKLISAREPSKKVPRAAFELGAVQKQLGVEEIGDAIRSNFNRRATATVEKQGTPAF